MPLHIDFPLPGSSVELPFFPSKRRNVRRLIQRQLIARNPLDVALRWSRAGELGGYHAVVGPMAAEFMGWKNSLFVPEDPLKFILFEEYSVDMRAVSFLTGIYKTFSVPTPEMSELYGELISVLRQCTAGR